MALERSANFRIKCQGEYDIKVDVFPDLKVIHLTQEGGSYHDEKTMKVTCTFNQLPDLLTALEEIRKSVTDSGRWDR
jgi:hypothetical protein